MSSDPYRTADKIAEKYGAELARVHSERKNEGWGQSKEELEILAINFIREALKEAGH